MTIKETENSIRFVIGDETVIEITPTKFIVNRIDESDNWMRINCYKLYSAFKAYQERCKELEKLNN